MENAYIRAVMEVEDNIYKFRYQSGRQVWDEILMDSKLIRRYINCNGQIYPENHMMPEDMRYNERLYAFTECFRLEVNGKLLSAGWEYVSFEKSEDNSGLHNKGSVYALILRHSDVGVEVKLCTRLDGSDFLVRWLEIKNVSDKTFALTQVSPLFGKIFTHRFYTNPSVFEARPRYSKSESVKNNGALYSIAYNHCSRHLEEGDFFFDDIGDETFEKKMQFGKSGFSRPAFWVRNNANDQTLVCEFAWPGNWQFRAWRMARDSEQLAIEFGLLQSDGEALRVLKVGEDVVSPAVHFGLFQDSDDKIVQLTHKHVRESVLPPLPEGVPVAEIEANHRGYLFDRENEKDLILDIETAHAVGAELYVIDAGWYGTKYPNEWWNNVGDWVAGPWLENGFEPIVEHAHKLGMRFGLWIEIEAFGPLCEARKIHPDYIMTRHGIPCAGGRAIDLAKPEVEQFCLETIEGAIKNFKLDMYRIDHNHHIGLGGTRGVDGFTENTLWRYYEAFSRIFRTLRRKYPNLVLQNCASGGGRLDWGTLNLFHNCELSDWLRMPRNTRIYNGVTMSLPPEILLRTFGTENPEMWMDGDINSQLRSLNISRPILRGIAPSVDLLSPYLKEKILHFARLYRKVTRPILKDCVMYHHTPFQPIFEAADEAIFELASKDKTRGMIAVFNTSHSDNKRMKVYPRGLSREKTYSISFDNSGETVNRTGDDLVERGLVVEVGRSMGSELIIINEI